MLFLKTYIDFFTYQQQKKSLEKNVCTFMKKVFC